MGQQWLSVTQRTALEVNNQVYDKNIWLCIYLFVLFQEGLRVAYKDTYNSARYNPLNINGGREQRK